MEDTAAWLTAQSLRAKAPTSASTPPSTFSPLLDTLPTELRLKIFRLALRLDTTRVRPARCWCPKNSNNCPHPAPTLRDTLTRVIRDIHSSRGLFAVSRQVCEEAQDAFFDVHTVVISDSHVIHPASHLFRSIEIRRGKKRRILPSPSRVLNACSEKLRTVVIAQNTFTSWYTLREYFKWFSKEEGRLRCVGLGVYRLESVEYKHRKILIKDFLLLQRLKKAESLLETTDIFTLYTGVQRRRHLDGHVRLLSAYDRDLYRPKRAKLAFWLAAYEASRTTPDPAFDVTDTVAHWESRFLYETARVPRIHKDLPNGAELQEVNVAEHGVEVVEWATELLGTNLRKMLRYHGWGFY